MNHKRLIIIVALLFIFFGIFYFGVARRISVYEYDAGSESFVRQDVKKNSVIPEETIVEPIIEAENNNNVIEENKLAEEEEQITEKIIIKEIKEDKIKPDEIEISVEKEKPVDVVNSAPFTPQAPLAEWSDEVFQDGCEEAVSLMAVMWAKGGSLTKEQAKTEIISASNYEKEKFGEYRDTSAKDTLERIIKGYFEYTDAEYKENITTEDIIAELKKGHLVITPMDGQKIGNPYYTPPGPERHMLLIIGYDAEKQEFITNDPGTKRGAGYRYSKDVLFDAIRDYATGYHEPFPDPVKSMIVIKK